MISMDIRDKIECRIKDITLNLDFLNDEMSRQMDQPIKKRSQALLDLLYREKMVYQGILSELENILNNEKAFIP
jgi:hypothetical protein